MGQYLIDALRDGLPAEVVVDDPDRVESFRFDKAQFCPAGIPAAVVLVRERAHVEHTLRTASRLGVPVVPQGARSGLSGAANAIDGCVVLSLERMDHIVEIDPANRIAVVEPGVFNAVLSRAVGEHGLFYPPDPSSWEFCTMTRSGMRFRLRCFGVWWPSIVLRVHVHCRWRCLSEMCRR